MNCKNEEGGSGAAGGPVARHGQAAYGQHMASVQPAHGQRTMGSVQAAYKACRQRMGSVWAAYRQCMGSLWAAYRQHTGSVWAAYEQHIGSSLPQLSTALQGQRLCATWDIPAPRGGVCISCLGKQPFPCLAQGSEIRPPPFFFLERSNSSGLHGSDSCYK